MVIVNYYVFGIEQQVNSVKFSNGNIGTFFETEKVTIQTKQELRNALKNLVLIALKTSEVSAKNLYIILCYNQVKNGEFYKSKSMKIPFNDILKWETSCQD